MTTAFALLGWLFGVYALAVGLVYATETQRRPRRVEQALVIAALVVAVVGSVAGGAIFL